MLKNEDNRKGIVNDDYNNNSYEFSSTAHNSIKKKFRKDAKGNLILKKKFPIKKTKHHAYLIDAISPEKKLANVIDIESYKKYNLEGEEEIEEDENENEGKLEESKSVVSKRCCFIF